MSLQELRNKHLRLTYKSYKVIQTTEALIIRFEFVLAPDIVFRPEVQIPYMGKIDEQALGVFAFHVGMIEMISYWKVACPAEIVVEAGEVSLEQIRFWNDLIIHGLGEFYYQNQIDFTQSNFFHITNSAQNINSTIERIDSPKHDFEGVESIRSDSYGGDLVLVSGGKDTAVTLALLSGSGLPFSTMVVNPTQASLANIVAAGLPRPIVVKRIIDPQLLALNKQGYMNGHTPFSAYLAFLGVLVASLYGKSHVIVSNERSADEGNVVYRGLEINHQYSKSFRFEELFRSYCAKFLTADIGYFSMLRPLNDIQISMIFSKHPDFFTTFRSCNVGSKTNTWCGACAKCAFTYLVLYPYLSHEQMIVSFGMDLFAQPTIVRFIRELVGLTQVKPFECVGTRDEASLSLLLCVEKYKKEGREVPEGLLLIKSDLGKSETDVRRLKESVMDHWGDTYNVTEEHLSLLRAAWANVEHSI